MISHSQMTSRLSAYDCKELSDCVLTLAEEIAEQPEKPDQPLAVEEQPQQATEEQKTQETSDEPTDFIHIPAPRCIHISSAIVGLESAVIRRALQHDADAPRQVRVDVRDAEDLRRHEAAVQWCYSRQLPPPVDC